MEKIKTIIHFSQDFTKGKPQLGGFSRIFNICSDANKHIIYTISTEILEMEEYYIDKILVIQVPVKERPNGVFNQFKLYNPIANEIIKHLKEIAIQPDLFFGHSHQGNFLILKKVRDKLFPELKILWEANGIGGCPKIQKPFKARIANRIQYRLQKYVFKKSDKIIAQTVMSKKFISDEFNIIKNKIEVVPNAIHTIEKQVNNYKNFEKIKILCFGLFDELNGIPFFVKILKKNSFKNIEFVFAGQGKYLNDIKELVNNIDSISYLGQLPYKEMMKVLPSFHYIVIPRISTLGGELYIPTKLLEAMQLGVIPICSDVKGMTCVVTDKINGFVFEKENTEELKKVFTSILKFDIERYNLMQKNAFELVNKKYSWEMNFKTLSMVYNHVSN